MSHQFEEEAFITVAKRTTYEGIVAEARRRQKSDERGWWDDETFLRCIENKLKRTDGGYRMAEPKLTVECIACHKRKVIGPTKDLPMCACFNPMLPVKAEVDLDDDGASRQPGGAKVEQFGES